MFPEIQKAPECCAEGIKIINDEKDRDAFIKLINKEEKKKALQEIAKHFLKGIIPGGEVETFSKIFRCNIECFKEKSKEKIRSSKHLGGMAFAVSEEGSTTTILFKEKKSEELIKKKKEILNLLLNEKILEANLVKRKVSNKPVDDGTVYSYSYEKLEEAFKEYKKLKKNRIINSPLEDFIKKAMELSSSFTGSSIREGTSKAISNTKLSYCSLCLTEKSESEVLSLPCGHSVCKNKCPKLNSTKDKRQMGFFTCPIADCRFVITQKMAAQLQDKEEDIDFELKVI